MTDAGNGEEREVSCFYGVPGCTGRVLGPPPCKLCAQCGEGAAAAARPLVAGVEDLDGREVQVRGGRLADAARSSWGVNHSRTHRD